GRRIGNEKLQSRLGLVTGPGKLPQDLAQRAPELVRCLPGHRADVQAQGALKGIARKPPRQTAANGGDGDVRMLAEAYVRRLVRGNPFLDVDLERVHLPDRVDDAGMARVR